jgi:hypothetical protein
LKCWLRHSTYSYSAIPLLLLLLLLLLVLLLLLEDCLPMVADARTASTAHTCWRRVSSTCRQRTMCGCATMRTSLASPAKILRCKDTPPQACTHVTWQRYAFWHLLSCLGEKVWHAASLLHFAAKSLCCAHWHHAWLQQSQKLQAG